MRTLSSIIVLLVITISCQRQQFTLPESQKSKIEKEITTEFMGLVHSHSLFDDTWLKYFSKTKFLGVNAGHTHYSLQGLADSTKNIWWPHMSSKKMEVKNYKIHILSATTAMIVNFATVYHVLRTKEERKFDIIETTIWENGPNGWKVIYWHYSS